MHLVDHIRINDKCNPSTRGMRGHSKNMSLKKAVDATMNASRNAVSSLSSGSTSRNPEQIR